jgi:hypothetical protein
MTLRLRSGRGTPALFALIAIALSVLVCFLLTQPSKAQDGGPFDYAQGRHGHGHAENHNMYKDWRRPDVGGSCCNAQTPDDPAGDCRPTTAYMGDDGWWRAGVRPGPNGLAVVPLNKILNRASDGRCHVCERHGHVLCFEPCDPKS